MVSDWFVLIGLVAGGAGVGTLIVVAVVRRLMRPVRAGPRSSASCPARKERP